MAVTAPTPRTLPTLLSQALVAFTVELDNEFEHRMAHTTTTSRARSSLRVADRGPWLTSWVMYANFLAYLGPEPVRVADVADLIALVNLPGLVRWRYVQLLDDEGGSRPSPPKATDWVQLTPAGRQACTTWAPLAAEIEARWAERFGQPVVSELKAALADEVSTLGPLPAYLPVLGWGMRARVESVIERDGSADLISLLAKVLMGMTLDLESTTRLPRALAANVVRAIGVDSVRMRDIPGLAGVSKEAVAMSMTLLKSRSLVLVDDSVPRMKTVALSDRGRRALGSYVKQVREVGAAWAARPSIPVLRRLLEPMVGDGTWTSSPLAVGLDPYPDNWRGDVRTPVVLPHHPMVLHRGGWPDGS